MNKVLKEDFEKTVEGTDPPANGVKDGETKVDISEVVDPGPFLNDSLKSSEVCGNSTKVLPATGNPSAADPPNHNTFSVDSPSPAEGINSADLASPPEISISKTPNVSGGMSKPSFHVHTIRITTPQGVS